MANYRLKRQYNHVYFPQLSFWKLRLPLLRNFFHIYPVAKSLKYALYRIYK